MLELLHVVFCRQQLELPQVEIVQNALDFEFVCAVKYEKDPSQLIWYRSQQQ